MNIFSYKLYVKLQMSLYRKGNNIKVFFILELLKSFIKKKYCDNSIIHYRYLFFLYRPQLQCSSNISGRFGHWNFSTTLLKKNWSRGPRSCPIDSETCYLAPSLFLLQPLLPIPFASPTRALWYSYISTCQAWTRELYSIY